MHVTTESSLPHASAIAHMPPETQVFIFQRDDQLRAALAELQRLKAQAPAPPVPPPPTPAREIHARVVKQNRKRHSDKLRNAITAMALRHALQLQAWSGSKAARARFIHGQIKHEIKMNKRFKGLRKPPWLGTVYKYLNTMVF